MVVVDQVWVFVSDQVLGHKLGGREDGCYFSSGARQPILNAQIRLQKCVFILSSDGRESSVSLLLLFVLVFVM